MKKTISASLEEHFDDDDACKYMLVATLLDPRSVYIPRRELKYTQNFNSWLVMLRLNLE